MSILFLGFIFIFLSDFPHQNPYNIHMKIDIPIPIYDGLILLAVDEDINSLNKFIQETVNIDISEVDIDVDKCGSGGMTLSLGNMVWCVYIPSTKELNDFNLVRVFSHEICHIVLELTKNIGIIGDESFCYLQDWLLGRIMVDYYQCTGNLKGIMPEEIVQMCSSNTKKSRKSPKMKNHGDINKRKTVTKKKQ
jgi:hypothetical protein